MKPVIAALLGSPLPSGNTALLLDQAIFGAADAGCAVRKIHVPSLTFSPCREIYACREKFACAMDDDVNNLYPFFAEMDGMILATPVMTMGIPGALKSFMDRFQVFYCAKYERLERVVPPEKRAHRKTLLISISGMNLPDNFDGVRRSTLSFCDIIDCRLADEFYVRDMDAKKDLRDFPDILTHAYLKGKALGEEVAAAAGGPVSPGEKRPE